MPDTATNEQPSFFKNLTARRVPQILCVYLAACWAILQFIDWVVNRYALSPFLPDLGLVVFLALVPSVLMTAYFHGKPGRTKWHHIEKVGVPSNLVLTGVLAFLLFSGKDLGSTQKKVTVSDESGQAVVKVVPKLQFRKKIALYFFENRSVDRELDWLQYAIPYLAQVDLLQDMYIEPLSPKDRDLKGLNFLVFQKMKEAGFPKGLGLPLMLMRQIASDFHQDYFLCGGVASQDGRLAIDFSLYRVPDAKCVFQEKVENADLFAAIDSMTARLRQEMEVPTGQSAKNPDLPIGDIFTRSLPAARLYVAAMGEMVFFRDWKAAVGLLEKAVSEDPSFASALSELSAQYMLQGETKKWQAIQKVLMKQLYKLPTQQQYLTKVGYYFATQEPEKQMAVLNMLISLYPEDISALYMQAQLYLVRYQLDKVLENYRRILQIDPQRYEILQEMASIYEMKGDFVQAEKCYREYAVHFPDALESFISLGQVKRKQGEFTQAREFFQKALLVKPDDVGARIDLARCEFHLGRFAQALAAYQDALAVADSPEEQYKAYGALEGYHYQCGQLQKSLAYAEQMIEAYRKFGAPLLVDMDEIDVAVLRAECGRLPQAQKRLTALEKRIIPPFNKYVAIGYISIFLEQGKAEEVEKYLPEVQSLIASIGSDVLHAMILKFQGQIAEMRGDCQGAIEKFLEVMRIVAAKGDVERRLAACYRKLADYAKAEALIQKVLKASPFDPQANDEAARIYWEMGKKEEALKYLRAAAQVWEGADPGYGPAQSVRERLQAWKL